VRFPPTASPTTAARAPSSETRVAVTAPPNSESDDSCPVWAPQRLAATEMPRALTIEPSAGNASAFAAPIAVEAPASGPSTSGKRPGRITATAPTAQSRASVCADTLSIGVGGGAGAGRATAVVVATVVVGGAGTVATVVVAIGAVVVGGAVAGVVVLVSVTVVVVSVTVAGSSARAVAADTPTIAAASAAARPRNRTPPVWRVCAASAHGNNARMPPRALWTGSITLGLVNVPVRVFSAVHEHRLQFHLVHQPDDGAIGYEKICKLEDKPVPNDEIVKAYEYKKGELVHLTDEDFEAVQVEGQHTIELEDFVPYEDIDPTFFAHTYLVGPQDGGEKLYALLVRAMEESGLAGIGKFVMRNRQYLGCLRVRDKTLTLEQLYFADEVDPPADVTPKKLPSVAKRELDMALSLIEGFSGKWNPTKYKDTYTDALRDVINAKRKGHDVHRAAEPEPDGAPDLMEALRLSIEQMQRSKRGGSRSGSRSSSKSPSRSRSRTTSKSK
jgi:DNA end-binding protein Ku